jgi:ATP-binding cassette subfamily C protein
MRFLLKMVRRFLVKMVRTYPGRTIIVLIAMLLAGLAEGFGLTTMLPLLSAAIDSQTRVAALQPSAW